MGQAMTVLIPIAGAIVAAVGASVPVVRSIVVQTFAHPKSTSVIERDGTVRVP